MGPAHLDEDRSSRARLSLGKHAWINEGMEKEYFGSSKGTRYQELSFLSLNEAVNRYPDTGESGDVYDIEATVDG